MCHVLSIQSSGKLIYMSEDDKIFADGMSFNRKESDYLIPLNPTRSTHFVLGRLSVKTEDFIAWIKQHTNREGWCNINIKQSKGGKFYCEKDTWEPKPKAEKKTEAKADDLPF